MHAYTWNTSSANLLIIMIYRARYVLIRCTRWSSLEVEVNLIRAGSSNSRNISASSICALTDELENEIWQGCSS